MEEFIDETGNLTPSGERSYLRFRAGSKTIAETLQSAGPDWLIEGWLASSATVVDGAPESGKSSLVAAMAAVIARGEPWLGLPLSTNASGPVIIITTDPSDAAQWAKKAKDLGVGADAWELVQFESRLWNEYEDLAKGLDARLLMFDNITGGVGGPINEANPSALLDPLNRIQSAGTPVVAIAHSVKQGRRGPMGPTAYTAWRRHGLSVSRRGDSQKVMRSGNLGSWPDVQLVGTPKGSAVEYQFLDGGSKPARSAETLDGRAEIAKWIVDNCQGVGVNQTGIRVAERFGGSPGARATSLKPKGSLRALLECSGRGARTTWKLKR